MRQRQSNDEIRHNVRCGAAGKHLGDARYESVDNKMSTMPASLGEGIDRTASLRTGNGLVCRRRYWRRRRGDGHWLADMMMQQWRRQQNDDDRQRLRLRTGT